MIGCPDVDPRARSWLDAAQWSPQQAVACWEIDLNRFQPPMDRTQIQIRRMAHVDRLLDEPQLPWYVASMLGHTEPIGFQLTNRQTRMVTAEIVVWTIGNELLPQCEMIAHLWPMEQPPPGQEDQLVFLVSEALRQLREDRVDMVRTVLATEDTGMARMLTAPGFRRNALRRSARARSIAGVSSLRPLLASVDNVPSRFAFEHAANVLATLASHLQQSFLAIECGMRR